jgi:hypothetical protein
MLDGSTSPSLANSLFNLNSLPCRVYMHNTWMSRSAPGNRSIIVGDLNTDIFMTGRSQLNAVTPKTVYRDAGSPILYGTPTTDTLIDSSNYITFSPAVAGNWTTNPTKVKEALDELAARSGWTGSFFAYSDSGYSSKIQIFVQKGMITGYSGI